MRLLHKVAGRVSLGARQNGLNGRDRDGVDGR